MSGADDKNLVGLYWAPPPFTITPKQLELAEFVIDYRDKTGMAPTVREIGARMGITAPVVHEHIWQLVRKNVAHRTRHQSRSILICPTLAREIQERRARNGCCPTCGRSE